MSNIDQNQSIHYAEGSIRKLTGLELLTDGASVLPLHIADYWQWAFSDIIRNTQRGIFAEYIVKAAMDLGGVKVNGDMRLAFAPYDLIGPDMPLPYNPMGRRSSRIEVKSASAVQAWETRHPERTPKLQFRIAKSIAPDETGDYPQGAVPTRNCDIYVFAAYMASSRDQNILDMNLWRFYVAKSIDIDNSPYENRQSISLAALEKQEIKNAGPLKFSQLCPELLNVCENYYGQKINEKDHPSQDGQIL